MEHNETSSNNLVLDLGEGHERLLESARRLAPPRQTFPYLAPPLIFGPWHPIAYHLGAVTYNITCSQDGDTLVVGEVKYFKYPSVEVTESLLCPGNVTIRTADTGANIQVRFKGVVLGTRVEVSI